MGPWVSSKTTVKDSKDQRLLLGSHKEDRKVNPWICNLENGKDLQWPCERSGIRKWASFSFIAFRIVGGWKFLRKDFPAC